MKAKATKRTASTASMKGTPVEHAGAIVGYVVGGAFVPLAQAGKASLPDATPVYDIRGLGVSDAKLVCKLAKLLGLEVAGEPKSWPEYDAVKAAHWKGAQYAVNVRHGEIGLIQVRAQYAEPRTG